jgi:putative DNA primase/helicase
VDTAALKTAKAALDLRDLVRETHPLVKGSKLHCLWHEDTTPSLHIYPDGYHCFACGVSGDHIDWLMETRSLTFQAATELLLRHSPALRLNTMRGRPGPPPLTDRQLTPLSDAVAQAHARRAAALCGVPEALQGRGFTLADCRLLAIAEENGDAVFPIYGSAGEVLALKRRYAKPDPHRYAYVTPGRGAPAWCSPDLLSAERLLIVEGELNGMVCWLALRTRHPQVGVIGTAGADGPVPLEPLQNRSIYIYADADEAGERARQRWAQQALEAGAGAVYVLEPWRLDACEVVGSFGKPALRKRLAWARKQQVTSSPAKTTAKNHPPFPTSLPALVQCGAPPHLKVSR